MKAFRIIQIILLLALVGYLYWFNLDNNWINLPLLIALPSGVVLGLGIGLGWLVGWFTGRSASWSKGREIKKLNKRITELEAQTPAIRAATPTSETAPIIPDRSGTFRTDSEYENI